MIWNKLYERKKRVVYVIMGFNVQRRISQIPKKGWESRRERERELVWDEPKIFYQTKVTTNTLSILPKISFRDILSLFQIWLLFSFTFLYGSS